MGSVHPIRVLELTKNEVEWMGEVCHVHRLGTVGGGQGPETNLPWLKFVLFADDIEQGCDDLATLDNLTGVWKKWTRERRRRAKTMK